MEPSDSSTPAESLCAQCGLCCNGVLFHNVRILGNDSIGELTALGLRIWKKKGERVLLQPCPAHTECSCRIYDQRPMRCRLFECRQLQRLNAGEITEADAREKIRSTKTLVAEIETLLTALGEKHTERPLSKRQEHIESEPLHPTSEPAVVEKRRRLNQAMAELNEILNADFRVE
ncbi:hypothetical protein BH09VER1_BH09VER1_00890 [soil metagenome]